MAAAEVVTAADRNPTMAMSSDLTASRKLAVLFVVLAGIPVAALGWLGRQVLEQDRALEIQRRRERLENAATLLTREVDRSLAAWEALLPTVAQGSSVPLPPDAIALVFDDCGVVHHQGARIPFYPLVPPGPDVSGELFAAAEAQEFRQEDLEKAAAAYRRMASTNDGSLRAAALVRLARALRKQERLTDALTAYGELAAMGETPVTGSSAELLARRERSALFKMLGDEEAATREAAALGAALWKGGVKIDRATFEFYRESAPPPPAGTLALAEAIDGLWSLWQQQAAGRAAWSADGRVRLSVWRRMLTDTAAIVIGIDDLLASAADVTRSLEVRFSLDDPIQGTIWGDLAAAATPLVQTLHEVGLPWTLRVVPADPAALEEVAAWRRNLLLAGFMLMVLVVAAASFFVYRAVDRELAVARLQSDFVAAVSHEFRTPLTALRHLTEMLEDGGVPGDRLPRYYRALGKESRRLHGMVESLLDFGRMEAGQRTYQMEDTSAAELARQVVHAFCDQVRGAAHRVELEAPPDEASDQIHGTPRIRVDREALALALRNLLDNAVKYSPESSKVSVSVALRDGFVIVSVTDDGPGIPKAEQQNVFRKFVRGTAAATLNVKGTGIGLAMADRIVRAHGGRIALTSEPGQGSRFDVLLPALQDSR